MTDLTLQLFALDTKQFGSTSHDMQAAARICAKLRQPISQLAGAGGYSSLLSRAVSLAKAELPSLANVCVGHEGTLEGINDFDQSDCDGASKAAVLLVSHFLNLLITFIGEPLTVALLEDAWPDESFARNSPKIEGKS
jgi:hypothetical protein